MIYASQPFLFQNSILLRILIISIDFLYEMIYNLNSYRVKNCISQGCGFVPEL